MLWDESELSNSISEKSLRPKGLVYNAWVDFGYLKDLGITFKMLWLLWAFFISFSNGEDTKKVKIHYSKHPVTSKFHWGKGRANSFLWWLLYNEAFNCPLFNIHYFYLSAPHTLYLYVWEKGSSLCTCIPHGGESLSPQCVSDLVLKWCSSASFWAKWAKERHAQG